MPRWDKPNRWVIWGDIAKENGISKGTFESRIYNLGWEPEVAARTPRWPKGKEKPYPKIRF